MQMRVLWPKYGVSESYDQPELPAASQELWGVQEPMLLQTHIDIVSLLVYVIYTTVLKGFAKIVAPLNMKLQNKQPYRFWCLR